MNTMFGPLEEAQPIKKATGIEMITEERKRQITVKGYDAEHDEDETAMQL